MRAGSGEPWSGREMSTGGPVEGVAQVSIMLMIGLAAGAGSFTHVHDVAQEHGQEAWPAWADAVVLELMSIAAGLELRRRKRANATTPSSPSSGGRGPRGTLSCRQPR
jgi:hypothetical protein